MTSQSALTVLSNTNVHSLLLSLSRDEVLGLQKSLGKALKDYSLGQESGCNDYQSRRTTLASNNETTTFLVPATTGKSVGFKVMSVHDAPVGRTEMRTQRERQPSAPPRALVARSKETARSLSSGPRSSDRPSQHESSRGRPGGTMASSTTTGSLTLLDQTGNPTTIINAQELSPFRTALISLMLFGKRERVRHITVFGAGRQAYWHIRLALLLRRGEIKRVNIISRSFDRATRLLREFYSQEHSQWREDVQFSAVSHDFVEYDPLVAAHVQKADVIFCCTTSEKPLFPAKFLASYEGKGKGRYISAIGSSRSSATELDPELILDAVEQHRKRQWPYHQHNSRGGVVVVDSIESCVHNAGEIVQTRLDASQLVEIGELIMMEEAAEMNEATRDQGLSDWIHQGNVIYKSVGLEPMDTVVGGELTSLANQRGMRSVIPEF